MAKLGLPRHRYAVGIICSLYLVSCFLLLLYCIFDTFSADVFVLSLINLAISCFGLYSLHSVNDTLMKSFGIIQVILSVMQVIDLVLLLIAALFKEYILNMLSEVAMEGYNEYEEIREIVDGVQTELQCCGRQSYNDWTLQPQSCCTTSNCYNYHAVGCVDALSPLFTYALLFIGLVCVIGTVIHIWGAVSAFALAKVYKRERYGPFQPAIKHGLTNF